MAKWWQFWRDDKAPRGGKGKPKPSGGRAGSGRVDDPPSKHKTIVPKNRQKFDGRAN